MLRLLPSFRENYPWYLGVLGVLVFTLFGLPYAMRVWRDVKEGPEDDTTDVEDVIGPLTDAYAAGDISKEEYEKIQNSIEKSSLGGTDP